MRRLCLALLLVACRGDQAPQPAADAVRGPVALTYLGVAGWQLDAAGATILVDPYFSRPDLDRPVTPDLAAIAAHAPKRADLVVVGHSHVDHVLDAPAVAAATGAQLVGSESTARLGRAGGLPADQVTAVRGGEQLVRSNFQVKVIRSLHSKIDGLITGEIAEQPQLPLMATDYLEGGTFAYVVEIAGHQILFLGTANFIEENLAGLRPDIAVIATGLRERVDDYTCRLMRVLGQPPRVYTNHFDDWRGPPVDEPPDDDLRAFVDEVKRCSPATEVVIPQHFVRMDLP